MLALVYDTFSEKERLQVVSERDGNDGEVGGECEDGEEAQEVMNGGQIPRLTSFGLKIQIVTIGFNKLYNWNAMATSHILKYEVS